jgi:hypothetical protein
MKASMPTRLVWTVPQTAVCVVDKKRIRYTRLPLQQDRYSGSEHDQT